jgi:hypothetical protein
MQDGVAADLSLMVAEVRATSSTTICTDAPAYVKN